MITPSPKRSAAPNRPSRIGIAELARAARAAAAAFDQRGSARMPPSPWLSARRMNDQVLDADDEHQRPEDQRQHAEHVGAASAATRVRRVPVREALPHRVERRRADVAVDDAERAEPRRRARGAGGAAERDARPRCRAGCPAALRLAHRSRWFHGLPSRSGALALAPQRRASMPSTRAASSWVLPRPRTRRCEPPPAPRA